MAKATKATLGVEKLEAIADRGYCISMCSKPCSAASTSISKRCANGVLAYNMTRVMSIIGIQPLLGVEGITITKAAALIATRHVRSF